MYSPVNLSRYGNDNRNYIYGIIFIERRGLIHQTPNVSKGVMNHAPTPQWGLMRNPNATGLIIEGDMYENK